MVTLESLSKLAYEIFPYHDIQRDDDIAFLIVRFPENTITVYNNEIDQEFTIDQDAFVRFTFYLDVDDDSQIFVCRLQGTPEFFQPTNTAAMFMNSFSHPHISNCRRFDPFCTGHTYLAELISDMTTPPFWDGRECVTETQVSSLFESMWELLETESPAGGPYHYMEDCILTGQDYKKSRENDFINRLQQSSNISTNIINSAIASKTNAHCRPLNNLIESELKQHFYYWIQTCESIALQAIPVKYNATARNDKMPVGLPDFMYLISEAVMFADNEYSCVSLASVNEAFIDELSYQFTMIIYNHVCQDGTHISYEIFTDIERHRRSLFHGTNVVIHADSNSQIDCVKQFQAQSFRFKEEVIKPKIIWEFYDPPNLDDEISPEKVTINTRDIPSHRMHQAITSNVHFMADLICQKIMTDAINQFADDIPFKPVIVKETSDQSNDQNPFAEAVANQQFDQSVFPF